MQGAEPGRREPLVCLRGNVGKLRSTYLGSLTSKTLAGDCGYLFHLFSDICSSTSPGLKVNDLYNAIVRETFRISGDFLSVIG